MGDPHAASGGQGQHPVDVSLRVIARATDPVVGEVAAVAQRQGVDGMTSTPDPAVMLMRCSYQIPHGVYNF